MKKVISNLQSSYFSPIYEEAAQQYNTNMQESAV